MALETDLLEHEDIFDGSTEIATHTAELVTTARDELEKVLAMGGAVAAVDNAYMKQQLVEANTARVRAVESGDQVVVGVNAVVVVDLIPAAFSGG